MMTYRGVVAACGLAAGMDLPSPVAPFILRGVRLIGVDSVICPKPNWIDASENTAGRPGLRSGRASQVMSLSGQISSDPRLRSEAV